LNWDLYDYAAAGLILLAALGGIFAVRAWIRTPRNRLLACIGVLILGAMVWVQLAVGLI